MDAKSSGGAPVEPAPPEVRGVPALATPRAPASKAKRKLEKPDGRLFWRGIIARMDPKLKEKLDQKLRDRSFRSYRALARWLGEHGVQISYQALGKYGKQFDRMIDAIKIATVQAKIIVKETRCDNEEMERALLSLVQTELFNVLVKVQEAKLKLEPSALYAIARATSSLSAARVSADRLNERFNKRVEKAVAETLARLDDERGRGLSPEGAAQMRAALMEIIE
jgi:hypothetical protein